MREAVELLEYSASNPTGVIIGKRWRREDGAFDHAAKAGGVQPLWVICEYTEIPGNTTHAATTFYRPVIRVKAGSIPA